MKELIQSLKGVTKDKKILFTMIGLFVASVILIIISLVNIRVNNLQIWSRYASFGENYYKAKWYYLFAFTFEGLIIGIFHNLLAARLFAKKGRIITMLFLLISIGIVLLSIVTLARVLDTNKGIL